MAESKLEQVGVEAVVKNFDGFQKSIAVVRREIERTGKAAKNAGGGFEIGAKSSERMSDTMDDTIGVLARLIRIFEAFVAASTASSSRTEAFRRALVAYNDQTERSNRLLLQSGQSQEKQSRGIVALTAKTVALTLSAAGLYSKLSIINKAVGHLGVSLGSGLGSGLIGSVTGIAGAVTSRLLPALGALVPMLGKVALGLGAIYIGLKVLRGVAGLASATSTLEGIINSFNRITQSVGVASNALLNDLRKAAGSTISDMQLMLSTNTALAGSFGKVGQQIGQSLPKLLEIARVQARATGQSVDFLFNSLVSGIKRSSPLLIDNTGLVLKVGEANQKYADSIGKSVDQLTAQETQIALLNATLEAGQRSIDSMGKSQETLAEKVARTRSMFQNIRNEIGLMFQPIFKAVQDAINVVVEEIQDFVRALTPFVQVFSKLGALMINALVWPFKQLGKLIAWEKMSRAFWVGGAQILAAFTNGILWTANRLLFPVIIKIATFIADFLVGESPPPMGPLHLIDRGGANVMLAWLEGFTGVSLEPVKQVAAQVENSLAFMGIAGKSREIVENRLAQLDAALQPFIDKLDIIKSQFEELRGPAEAALQSIDRQLNKAVQALVDGEEGSAAMVRQLDRQREAIEGTLDAQQQQIDQAQIQLALAKQQQSTERTLLGIRLRQLGPVEKIAQATEKAIKGAKPGKVKTPTGVGVEEAAKPDLMGVSAEDLAAAKGTDVGILAEAQATFLKNTQFQRDMFETNRQALKEQFGRIAQGGEGILDQLLSPFKSLKMEIGKALNGLGTLFDVYISTPISNAANAVYNAVLGDENSIKSTLEGIGGSVGGWVGDLYTDIRSAITDNFGIAVTEINDLLFGEENSLKSFIESIPANLLVWTIGLPIKIIETLVGGFALAVYEIGKLLLDPNHILGLARFVGNISGGVAIWLSNLPDQLIDFLSQPFSDIVSDIGETILDIGKALKTFFFTTGEGSLFWYLGDLGGKFFQLLVDPIQSQVEGFISWMVDNTVVGGFAKKIYDFFSSGGGEGTIGNILSQGIDRFKEFVEGIPGALRNVGIYIWDHFALPIISVLNWVIARFRDFLNTIDSALGVARSIGIDIPEIGEIGLISTEIPGFLGGGDARFIPSNTGDMPGGATGGLFSEGLLRVGERGQEFIGSASKLAVFPNEFVRAVDVLNNMLTGMMTTAPMMGSTTNIQNIDNSMTGNFNMNRNARDTFREFSMLRAFSR